MNAFYRTVAATLSMAVFLAPVCARAQTASTPPAPDVLVVGGTPAGVAAAVSAARRGDRVTLVSDDDDLGGTLTDSMMDQWDLNLAPDGSSLQQGIFAEMYARLGDVFGPLRAEHVFTDLVAAEPNVSVVYDARPIAAHTTAEPGGRRIDTVTFASALRAPQTIHAPYVIDATDSGDVAVLAGARFDIGRQDSGIDERTQAVTEMFTVAGVNWNALSASYDVERYGAGGVMGRRAWGYSDLMRAYRPLASETIVRDLNLGLLADGRVSVNAIDICDVDGLDARQREGAKMQTEIEAPRLVAFLRSRVPGFEDARVATFAPAIYVRETRHIAGVERLTTSDVWNGRIPADSIGLASYPIDLHPVDPSDEPAYAPERHVYGIPFGALVPAGLTNVLLASPAISASHLASGSARVIPTTIEEAEADGDAVVAAKHAGFLAFDEAGAARTLAFDRAAGRNHGRAAQAG